MKWWYYVIIAVIIIIAGLVFVEYGHSQTDPVNVPPADVQALQSQLAGAGCNAALNAAASEIIKLRKEVAQLQAAQMQGKSGPTKK